MRNLFKGKKLLDYIEMIPKINLKEKIKEIDGRAWYPVEVARYNDQVVHIALYKGQFHWHKHDNQDELFYVVKGEIIIQIKGGKDITVKEGEFATVPKGVKHCPKSLIDSYVLMFDPVSLDYKGD
ncbi:MAG: cupin domain-containing protein [Flavobacteriales bacterium]|nr:cupin domain-containing protein [Flavobacteriales bacterium]